MDSQRIQNRSATPTIDAAASRQLGNVVERVSDAVVALDKAWRYTYLNQEAGKLFGRRPEDLIGKHIWTEFPEGVGQPFHKAYEQAISEQRFIQIEEYYEPWQRWFENRIFPSPDGLSIFFHDITEQKQSEEAARESSRLLQGQNQILELIARGTPLEKTLEALINVIEAQSPGMLGSILVLDPDGMHLRHAAAPSLPDNYICQINGEAIGPRAGSCGTAAYWRKQVIVEDIATDPLWAGYRDIALTHGLRACWSTPILDEQQRVLGTFAMYYRQPGLPSSRHLKQIAMATYTAAIAITRHRRIEALRASEERLRLAVAAGAIGIWEWDVQTSRLIWNTRLMEMFGWRVDDENLTLARFMDAVHPEDRQRVEMILQRSLARQVEYDIEYRILWPNGSAHWIAARGSIESDGSGAPVRMRGAALDITDHKNAEEEVKRREALLAEAQRIAKFGSYEWIPGNDTVHRSEELCRIFGVRYEDFAPTFEGYLQRVHPEDRENTRKTIERALCEQKPFEFEERIVLPDGSIRQLLSQGKWIFDEAKKTVKLVGICQDITASKEAERAKAQLQEQLRQIQKMDSIGRLAGGIAHDFNNLLNVILGYSDLSQEGLQEDHPVRNNVDQIKMAAEKATALTRRLLAFSRQQVLQPTILDLNAVVKNLSEMMTPIIGEDVSLQITAGQKLGSIKADRPQVEQVLMNLMVNARDAMPKGGKIFIETANTVLDENYARLHSSVRPGSYVMLAVTDSGSGMDARTMSQIFEPFFTTKPPGEGTGLGLSVVYGVVKQSGADIEVYSEPGKGTTFKLYFPRIDQPPETVLLPSAGAVPKGSETILLVEDEDALRDLISTVLVNEGYKVLQARDAASALAIAERFHDDIHLVLTDVVMPEMNGADMASRLRISHPELRLLYMSGYTGNLLAHHGVLNSDTRLLQKPFTKHDLLVYVCSALQGTTQQ